MQFLVPICALFLLTACGFEPVHGTKVAQSNPLLEMIKVEVPSKGRTAQIYRIALEDALHPGNQYPEPRYHLVSQLEETKQPIIIERDAQITRYNMVLKSTYELIDIASSKKLFSKHSQRISSYNVSDSDFATFIAERDARRNGIEALARTTAMEIATRLKAMQ
ncbi:MAG: hypothetical protein P8P30_00150 [Rickettsiales bacterium]|nr:hypothetical protein [Rickettsiales bacterium]